MIQIIGLSKTFTTADGNVEALKNINLTINDGDIYGIIGMSGAGKSTLVRCINMLEKPTVGKVVIDGRDIGGLSPSQLRVMRRSVGMIFQNFNLLQQRGCLENIRFPLELMGVGRAEANRRALELLETVGLPDKAKAYPSQLSGGQMQRVAIARALATDPKVLLCDEATSALDPQTTHSVLELIKSINKSTGITVVMITHQMSVVEDICNRVAILDGGEVAEEGEVSRVFASPASAAAKRLVYPEDVGEGMLDCSGMRTVRVIYHGSDSASAPAVTAMAMDIGIAASILYASTRCIGDRVYGNMLLGVPDDNAAVGRVIEYLTRDERITAREVTL